MPENFKFRVVTVACCNWSSCCHCEFEVSQTPPPAREAGTNTPELEALADLNVGISTYFVAFSADFCS